MQGLIPQPFIDEVLNRTDIIEFIDSYVPLKKQGTSFVACCPFHNEKNPSFHVIPRKQFYHCFGCGTSGNVISFAINYLHHSFPDAIQLLATRIGLSIPKTERNKTDNISQNLYKMLERVSAFYQKELQQSSGLTAKNYLQKRGVSREIAEQYQLGYASPAWQTLETIFPTNKQLLIKTGMLVQKDNGKTYDRYRQRLIFPIHDRNGRIIGFGGRALDEEQKPKYLNSPETPIFQKSRELYGLHQVLQHKKKLDEIIIVEGYIDVITLAQYGIFNAVATLGTSTSSSHIQLLIKYTNKIIFCFDGDTAGRQAAWKALENSLPHLGSGLDAKFAFLPETHDPDSLVRQEGSINFLQRLNNAKPLHELFFDTLTKTLDISSLAGKSHLLNLAKPHIQKIPESPYKQLIFQELARITHIDSHRINQLINEDNALLPPKIQTNIKRTPARVALALLIQHPEIYIKCAEKINSTHIDPKKHLILHQIMQQIAQNPTINTAALIESWRHTQVFNALHQLATWEHHVPEKELTNEFIDITLFLSKQTQDQKIDQLIAKARKEGLNEMERLTLQSMLKQKHKA